MKSTVGAVKRGAKQKMREAVRRKAERAADMAMKFEKLDSYNRAIIIASANALLTRQEMEKEERKETQER